MSETIKLPSAGPADRLLERALRDECALSDRLAEALHFAYVTTGSSHEVIDDALNAYRTARGAKPL